jgi:photosystem II stability/assembly factor-like uncharacterized protein
MSRPAPSTLAALTSLLALAGCGDPAPTPDASTTDAAAPADVGSDAGRTLEGRVRDSHWTMLEAAPRVARGKQDDMWWLDPTHGFLASGPNGSIYETLDSGASWSPVMTSPTTYFRALLFTDAMHGFAGNIGAGLSPSISDANVLYRTVDGGDTWTPVTEITGDAPSGLCNFTAVDATHLFGIGRANGPTHLLSSSDGGATWTSVAIPALRMAIDAHFSTPTTGLVAGMNEAGHCAILRTTDGGASFEPVFESSTESTLCWKLHFPSENVGYVAVQDTTVGPATFARTHDGGLTWEELPLPTSFYPAIGVGFLTDEIGWMVSEDPSMPAYRTFDGGDTWEEELDLVGPINRFRFVDDHTVYAVGGAVWTLDVVE